MNWKLIRIIDTYIGRPLLFAAFLLRRLFGQNKPKRSGIVKRILLVKFWGIGNIFMILPSIAALRAAYPDVIIDFLTLAGNEEALTATGVVDEINTIDTAGISRFIFTWLRSVLRLRKCFYDIVIDFEQFARFSALVVHQIGAEVTIGFDTTGQHRSSLYTRMVPYDNTVHISISFFTLATTAGGVCPLILPYMVQTSIYSMYLRGRELLSKFGVSEYELVVVMHIGTSDNLSERRWLPERYAELSDLLIETLQLQVRVVFTGLANESSLVSNAMAHMHLPTGVVDLSGQLSFAEYFDIIATADLVISADTSAVHMASSLEVPVVGLYGPNTPILYGPWGKKGLAIYRQFECSPCITNFNAKFHTCRHPLGKGACMNDIQVKDVYEAIYRHYFVTKAPCRLAKLGRE